MSLNWNLSGIANHDTLCWRTATEDRPDIGEVKGEQYMTVTCERVIFLCMAVGVTTLTAANIDEFIFRVCYWECVHGVGRRRRNDAGAFEEWPFTASELRQYVGLRTNASPMSRAKFLTHTANEWARYAKVLKS